MSEQYPAFPKVPRLNRSVTITEKIDGTNALVSVRHLDPAEEPAPGEVVVEDRGRVFGVRAGSRTRWLVGGKGGDNFGFQAWVADNAQLLIRLGIGLHYGEWWGPGIGRQYSIAEKRFSLFDQRKYVPECVSRVPVILTSQDGDSLGESVAEALSILRERGSIADPGYPHPEGIIVRHSTTEQIFKVLLVGDRIPKSLAA